MSLRSVLRAHFANIVPFLGVSKERSERHILLSRKLLHLQLDRDQLELTPPCVAQACQLQLLGKGSFSSELSMVAELLSQQLVRASRSFFREATLGTTRNHGGKMEIHPAPAGLNSRLAMQPSWGHGQSHPFGANQQPGKLRQQLGRRKQAGKLGVS